MLSSGILILSITKGYLYRAKKKAFRDFFFPLLIARQEKSQERIVGYEDILEN
jgi:hypothetical protein